MAAANASKKSSKVKPPSSSSYSIPTVWSALTSIAVVDVKSQSSTDFYSSFVAKRVPVVVRGLIADANFNKGAWSLPSMTKTCADVSLYVESRDKTSKTFGTGQKAKMSFVSFAKKVQSGEEALYLTTQPIEEDEEGLPSAVFGAPIGTMLKARALPLRPELMGNLLPANINVWIGRSASGSSSNLHHDFHDNLYMLLSGKKRFTIAAPSWAHDMYMHGTITHIHPNGLINYQGVATREDGAVPHVVYEKLLAAGSTKSAKQSSKSKPEAVKPGSDRTMKAALQDIEEAVARDPIYAATVAEAFPDDIAIGVIIDNAPSQDESTDAGDDADAMWAALTTAAPVKVKATTAEARPTASSIPDHFSKVPLPELRAKAEASGSVGEKRKRALPINQSPTALASYPSFGRVKLLEVELQAGEMLYLPAGWFHEVVSSGDGETGDIHCAVNYWYYPPSSKGSFEHPYEDTFWHEVFERQLKRDGLA